jgi:hypothetical protein
VTSAELLGLLSGTSAGPAPSFLTLHESAAGLGRLRFVEVGFFERVGRRAAALEPAPVAIWADSASRAAAWRASLLAELLPVSVGLPDAEELTRSAGPAVDQALDRLGPPAGDALGDPPHRRKTAPGAETPRPAADWLDGPDLVAYVVKSFYPALLGAYEARQASHCPAADPPVLRVLARVVADLRAELSSAHDLGDTSL